MKLPSKGAKDGPFSLINRFLWTRLTHSMITIYTPKSRYNETDAVLLNLVKGQSVNYVIDLTSLTEEELAAFRESVLIATDLAAPIVKAECDRVRKDMENGDDSDPRCYRPLPSIVVRKGAFRGYTEGLLDGRQDVLQGVELKLLSGNRPAESGGEVAE